MKVIANKNLSHNNVDYKKGDEIKDSSHKKSLVDMGHADLVGEPEAGDENQNNEGGGEGQGVDGADGEGAEGGQGDDVENNEADGEGQGDEGAEAPQPPKKQSAKPAQPKRQPAKK